MVKSTKNHRIWFFWLRLILFLGFIYVLLYQIGRSGIIIDQIDVKNYFFLTLVILLVPFNWWIEYVKWKITLGFVSTSVRLIERRSSFMAGMVTGMLTPNMLGNFIGRIYYFQRRDRISITLLTLISNFTQFFVSMLFGVLALFILGRTPLGENHSVLLWTFVALTFLAGAGLFFFGRWIRILFPRRYRLILRIRELKGASFFALRITGLSVLRFMIFTTQLALTLIAFGGEWDQLLIMWIWQYFMWLTLSPSLFLGKFIVRDSVAIWLFGFAGFSAVAVLPSSLFIWMVNLLIPTLMALFFIKQKPK